MSVLGHHGMYGKNTWQYVLKGDVLLFRVNSANFLVLKAQMIDDPTIRVELLDLTKKKKVVFHRDASEPLNGEILARL